MKQSPTNINIRPWTLDDLIFTLTARNEPELMKWYRQDAPIMLEDQKKFIERDLATNEYGGHVIEADGEKVGLCGVKKDGEFTIGLLPEHQGRGIARYVMEVLTTLYPTCWSEVFVGNPALEFFILCGFKVVGVKERAYYKRGIGLVDIVKIAHD